MVDGKKGKKKTFGNPTYNEELGVLQMSFNPVDVFKKSNDLKEDDKENE